MRAGLAKVLLVATIVGCSDDHNRGPSPGTFVPDDHGATPTDPGDPVDPTALDPLDADFVWTPSGDYSLELVQPVPDLDGDGLSDAVVRACLPGGPCEPLVVYGPLRRDLVLPGDEGGSLPTWIGGVAFSGDLTGDGLADLVMVGGDNYQVFVGPILGPTEPADDLWGQVFDVNDDGILDLASFGDPQTETFAPRLEIRYGPMSQWDGEADVALDPSCDEELDSSDWSWSPSHLLPDFTGDGLQELSFVAYGYADTCTAWILTPPPPGVYDPELDLGGVTPTNNFWPVPDQTGDGIADLVFTEPGESWEMVAGPVSFTNGIASGGEVLATTLAEIGVLSPIEFDLNGDGIGEFLARFGSQTRLVYGGPEGLAAGTTAPTWTGTATQAWLEEGVVSMAVPYGGAVGAVELGEGVAVDNWPE
jgi:hypothetical protein